jgi:hypothetical protein
LCGERPRKTTLALVNVQRNVSLRQPEDITPFRGVNLCARSWRFGGLNRTLRKRKKIEKGKVIYSSRGGV